MRASALVTALVIVLAGCTSEQTLAPDPAGAEPGYPQYTPPATSPDGVSPSGTPDAAGAPDDVPAGSGPSPIVTPSAEPTLTPTATATPSETPSPTAEPSTPSPTAAPTTAPSTPAPTTPPMASPTTPPTPTTPAALTLQTQTWQPRCGAALAAPPAVNDLSVAVTLQTAAGGPLQTEAVLSNGAGAPVAAERYVSSVSIARSGIVVSTWAEGQDAGPAIALAARGTLVVPVFHDLAETCPAGGVRDPGPPATTSTSASAVAPAAPGDDDLVLDPEPAGGSAQLGSLPAGDYTAVVAIHLVRDGGIGTSVVATSGVVPLIVTDAS